MIIESRAPTRIDLAGGTLDLWPLYLLLEECGPVQTIPLSITLFAQTRLEWAERSGKPGLSLATQDLGLTQFLPWDEVLSGEAHFPKELILLGKLARHYARSVGDVEAGTLHLSTSAKSPAGAGLGGSSALAISLIGALHAWAFPKTPLSEKAIEIARDIETTVIRVPAGLQDYYGAYGGGLQRLLWQVGSMQSSRYPGIELNSFSQHIALFYSGQSRNSGINNWSLFKSLVDQDPTISDLFKKITLATQAVDQALRSGNTGSLSDAIAQEWEARRRIAPGISTPEIDQAFEKARALGIHAGKICGAGGGGCFFFYEPSGDVERLQRLSAQVTQIPGVQELEWGPAHQGLEVHAVQN